MATGLDPIFLLVVSVARRSFQDAMIDDFGFVWAVLGFSVRVT